MDFSIFSVDQLIAGRDRYTAEFQSMADKGFLAGAAASYAMALKLQAEIAKRSSEQED